MSYEAKIAGYLPAYWKKGPGIDKVTFRHLLTHKSGFSTGGSGSGYGLMKSKVAAGVSNIGMYDYENMNFGLCRILIPIINGNVSKTATFGVPSGFGMLLDKAWDITTIKNYRNFMRGRVFSPAGVKNNPNFAPAPGPRALAYPVPPTNKDGWNSGDLATISGGAGWRLSANEVLNVMDHVRRRNTIMSKETAQYMLDSFFGIDQKTETAAGTIYNKNGFWRKNDGRMEQCVAYFFPNDMEAVVFVNSKIGAKDLSLRNLVRDAFKNSLK
jgi:CubicO group peptidase (beta-lactamase class C family)